VAARCVTFEELLDSSLGPVGFAESTHPTRILVQGHCHQRSLTGMGPLLRLLGRIPGAKVIDLDAGCCGMAGSFGYEKEHYGVSRLVGEDQLFPALRRADKQTLVVAPGFSCRMQIEHFTGIHASHPAEVLMQMLSGYNVRSS
jgi:Fe-S oxidoreductase